MAHRFFRPPVLWLLLAVLGGEAPSLGAQPALLTAQGTRLIDASGKPVQLKGVNLGGWLLQETWMTPVKGSGDHWTTRQTLARRFGAEKAATLFQIYEDHWITRWDLDAIKDLGFNAVRVPFASWTVQDDDGTWHRKTDGSIDFGKLDWVVRQAGEAGLYVILDLHGAPGYASNEHSSGRVGASRLFAAGAEGDGWRQKTIDLWTEVARHFRGVGTVAAYDLLNEPMAKPSDQELWAFYDRIIQAIRRVDPGHLISVEAVWEVANLPPPTTYGWTNMLYQTHDYGWDQDQARFIERKMQASALAGEYGVPLLVGEFTAFGKMEDWDRTLGRYDEAGYQWTFWTWKLTKKGTTPWAVYTSPWVASPDVAEDEFDAIAEAWAQTSTEGGQFGVNSALVQALKRSLGRPPYPGSTTKSP